MKNGENQLSARALVLVALLALLIPLMSVLSYEMGKLHAGVENFSCQVDVLACEARATEALSQCLQNDYQRYHGEIDFEMADPARFGEVE